MVQFSGVRVVVFLGCLILAGSAACISINRYNLRCNAAKVDLPDKTRFQHSFEAAADWMLANPDRISAEPQPYLWWYLKEAAERTQHPGLMQLMQQHRADYLARNRLPTGKFRQPGAKSVGNLLLVPEAQADLIYRDAMFERATPKSKALIAALTCHRGAIQSPAIQQIYDRDFCAAQMEGNISASCKNKQIAALVFLQSRSCSQSDQYAAALKSVQDDVVELLHKDPRVSDVYIQRLVWLTLTGAGDRIENIWLQRVIQHQRDDGGWLPYQRIVNLVPGWNLSVGRRFGISFKEDKTTFHTSVQGMLLMALHANRAASLSTAAKDRSDSPG